MIRPLRRGKIAARSVSATNKPKLIRSSLPATAEAVAD
jgi:hypothetical protein